MFNTVKNVNKIKNHSKENLARIQEPDKFQKENQPDLNGQNQDITLDN